MLFGSVGQDDTLQKCLLSECFLAALFTVSGFRDDIFLVPLTSRLHSLQDISNLRDFFEVNLEMTKPSSPVTIFDVEETIVSRGHILPPSMINKCEIEHSLLGEGSSLRVSAVTLGLLSSTLAN